METPGQAAQARETLTFFSGLSFRHNFSWSLGGNLIYAACQWGILVILAKMGSPEMVGQFGLGLAITGPVILFASLHLRGVQATDARGEYFFGQYLGLRLTTTTLALLFVVITTWLTGYSRETKLVILVVGLEKSCECVSDLIYGLFQQHERMDRFAISAILKGPSSLLVMGLCLLFTKSVFWGVLGLALVRVVVTLTYDLRNAIVTLQESPLTPRDPRSGLPDWLSCLKPRWSPAALSSLAWLSLPLGIVVMLQSLSVNMPRYFIGSYQGERELGFYVAMAYLLVAGNMVVSALGLSASPRLAKYFAGDQLDAFYALVKRVMLALVGVGVLGIILTLVA